MLRRATLPGVFAVLLAGCGDDAAREPRVLRVANWSSPAVVTNFMRLERQLVSEFEARHPGVRVRIEQIPGYGQFTPKVLLAHLTGSPPDVIQLDASSAAVFMDNGVLRDLRPYLARDPDLEIGQYFERVLEVYSRGERIYAIPLDFTPMVMYYNKRLLDAAGVAYPQDGWSWGDFVDLARRLTLPGPAPGQPPRQFGFAFENVMPFWILWLWTNGGDVLAPSGDAARGHFDGPRSVEAVEFLRGLMLREHVAPSLRESALIGQDLFLEGRAAMALKGHWMLIDYRAKGLDVGVVGLPTNRGQPPVTVLYASGLSIMARAAEPDLAWEYIRFITSADVQRRRVAFTLPDGRALPGVAISGNRVAAEHFAADPLEQVFLAQVPRARPPWGARVERYGLVEELGQETMRDLLYAGPDADVAAELRRCAERIDAVLRRR